MGHVVQALGVRVWSRFFDMTAKKVQDGFQPRGLERWQIGQVDQARKSAQNGGLWCILRRERKPQIRVGLFPTWGASKSLFGWPDFTDLAVGFSHPISPPPELTEVTRLSETLEADGYITKTNADWWIGRKSKVFSIGDDFVVDCVKNCEAISDRAASLVLDLLSKHGPEIEAADIALAPPQ